MVEKPIATTRDDLKLIYNAVKKNKIRLMTDLHNRWSPTFEVTKKSIEGGELGKLMHAYFRLNDKVWVATDMLPGSLNLKFMVSWDSFCRYFKMDF